jgi:GNAT superfamily N-acetyltransferase
MMRRVRIESAAAVTAPLAAEIAAVTRAGYLAGDLVPGLPPADGSRETGARVQADLAAGRLLWLATAGDACVGSVRASPLGRQAWEVHRLSVAPQARGAGLGLRLLRAVESAAVAAGMLRVELNAVVERGTPAFYAAAGYRVTRHFPAPDKALSEVRMQRCPGRDPQRRGYPAGSDDGLPAGLLVTWWAVPGGTACLLGQVGTAAPAALHRHRQLVASSHGVLPELLGADCWAGAPERAAGRLRAVLGAPATGHGAPEILSFGRAAVTIPAFAQPRRIQPELLAWWRLTSAKAQVNRG